MPDSNTERLIAFFFGNPKVFERVGSGYRIKSSAKKKDVDAVSSQFIQLLCPGGPDCQTSKLLSNIEANFWDQACKQIKTIDQKARAGELCLKNSHMQHIVHRLDYVFGVLHACSVFREYDMTCAAGSLSATNGEIKSGMDSAQDAVNKMSIGATAEERKMLLEYYKALIQVQLNRIALAADCQDDGGVQPGDNSPHVISLPVDEVVRGAYQDDYGVQASGKSAYVISPDDGPSGER